MAIAQLGNCPKCRKLFLRTRDLCPECYQKQEEDYQKAVDFLRDHSGCTIQELSDETNVSVSQIRQFILARRIIIGEFPNLSYPCDMCGSLIRTGKTCNSCTSTVNQLAFQIEKGEEKHSHEQKKSPGGYKSHY